jgi:hypothetical protein
MGDVKWVSLKKLMVMLVTLAPLGGCGGPSGPKLDPNLCDICKEMASLDGKMDADSSKRWYSLAEQRQKNIEAIHAYEQLAGRTTTPWRCPWCAQADRDSRR